MMITPITGTNTYTIRYNRLYWSLTGPSGLPETVQGWQCHALQDGVVWPMTAVLPTKWQAIAQLLRVIAKPWTY